MAFISVSLKDEYNPNEYDLVLTTIHSNCLCQHHAKTAYLKFVRE